MRGNWTAALMGVFLGAFIPVLSVSSIAVAVPSIMADFQVGAEQAQWIVNVYTMILAVVIPLAPWVACQLGDKQTYLSALICFTSGSLLCSLSPTLPLLLTGRIVQAIGGGLLIPITMAIIYRVVPPAKIGAAMGIWGLATMAAPAFGPPIAGFAVETFGWQSAFWLDLPAGIAGVALGAWFITKPPNRQPSGQRFDVPGFLTLTAGLIALQLALSQGSSRGWSAGPAPVLLTSSVISLLGFVWWELRQQTPLLDLHLFSNRTFAASAICLLMVSAGLYSGVFYIPILMQSVMGQTATQVGLILLPGAILSAMLQLLIGRLYERAGARTLVVTGMLVLMTTNYLCSLISLKTSPATMAWLTALRGVGVGLAYMPAVAAGLSVVANQAVAGASSLSNVLQRLGGSVSLSGLTTLYIARESYYALTAVPPKVAMVRGMGDMFLVASAFTAVGLVAAVALGGRSAVQPPPTIQLEPRSTEGD